MDHEIFWRKKLLLTLCAMFDVFLWNIGNCKRGKLFRWVRWENNVTCPPNDCRVIDAFFFSLSSFSTFIFSYFISSSFLLFCDYYLNDYRAKDAPPALDSRRSPLQTSQKCSWKYLLNIFEEENNYLDNFHLNAWFQLGELKINGDWELAANWTKSALKESRIVLMEFRHCPPPLQTNFGKTLIWSRSLITKKLKESRIVLMEFRHCPNPQTELRRSKSLIENLVFVAKPPRAMIKELRIHFFSTPSRRFRTARNLKLFG